MRSPKILGSYITAAKKLLARPSIQFAIGTAIGLVIFTVVFGLSTVNPANINWIQNIDGDLAQHYMSWAYFREAPILFPEIGKINNLAYPTGISLVYMDIIPFLALFFKMFSGLLPEHFQYFGLFTLTSFMLHGGFAILILGRFTNRLTLSLFGTVILVCTPLIISRSFGHTALAAHWLILAAIFCSIKFYQDRTRPLIQLTIWSVLMISAVLTHAYFIPIIGFILLAFIVMTHKSIKRSIALAFIPIVSSATVFALIGGLERGMETYGDPGLGLYSANLLGLFIPMGYSTFIDSTFSMPQWEGLAYPGLGVLLLLPVVWFIILHHYRSLSAKGLLSKIIMRLRSKRIVVLILITVLLIFVSLSPAAYIGDTLLYTAPTPGIIEDLWEIFRSTGRLVWPLYYVLIIGVLVLFFTYTKRWSHAMGVVFLLPFLVIQVLDITSSHVTTSKSDRVAQAQSSEVEVDPLNAAFIESYCGKDTVVLVDNSIESGIRMFHNLSDFIIMCKPTLTAGYFARFPVDAILEYANQRRVELVAGTLRINSHDLYITQSGLFVDEINQEIYSTRKIGGYWVITEK